MNRLVLLFLFNLFLAPLTSHSQAFAADSLGNKAPIGRFEEIVPGVWRGKRPTLEGLQYLQKAGFKTIINLDNDDAAIAWESLEAEKLGLKMISTPMSGFWKPKTRQVNGILELLANENNYPLFFHCQHGRDRTGLITGLFRVLYQGWEPVLAHREMLDKGFRRALIFLDQYFIDRTGYNPYQKTTGLIAHDQTDWEKDAALLLAPGAEAY